MNLKVSIFVNNDARPPLVAEHGLALGVEYGDTRVLFDTGAGQALLPNLEALQILPSSFDYVILSHGHYDHTGALAKLPPNRVYLSSRCTQPHWSRHADGRIREISMPISSKEALIKCNQVYVNQWMEVSKGMWLTGPISRVSGEDAGGDFYCESTCETRDDVLDEQALVIETGVLIQGCCHAGIVNTLNHCQENASLSPIHTIIGGLHLVHASEERLHLTAEAMNHFGIKRLYLMHCTGERAVEYLKAVCPRIKIEVLRAGDSINL